MNPIQISHNPFTRSGIIRTKVKGQCFFCCLPAKFKYGRCDDAFLPKTHWFKGEFCGISCARAYHGAF